MTEEGKIDTGAGEARRVPWLDIVGLAVIGLVLVVFFRVVGMYLAIALNIGWRLIVRRPVHHNQRLLWTCVFGAPVAFVVVTLIAAPFSPAMLHAPWLRSAIDVAVIPMPLDRILLTLLGEEVPGGDWIMTQFAKPVWYAQFYTPLYPAIFLGFCAGMAWFAVMLPIVSSVMAPGERESGNKTSDDKQKFRLAIAVGLILLAFVAVVLNSKYSIMPGGPRLGFAAPFVNPALALLMTEAAAWVICATLNRQLSTNWS